MKVDEITITLSDGAIRTYIVGEKVARDKAGTILDEVKSISVNSFFKKATIIVGKSALTFKGYNLIYSKKI